MPSHSTPLGSLSLRAPLNPQTVHVSSSTCHDLSLFKEILKEYRRLDDTIIMRLNRANAIVRDRERSREYGSSSTSTETVQNQACLALWRELIGNWKRRTQLVEYCASVVDQSLEEKRNALRGTHSSDPSSRRKMEAAIFADEVKRNQVKNEVSVESIIRKRAVDAFNSRCQYFVPPPSDEESLKIWEKARQ